MNDQDNPIFPQVRKRLKAAQAAIIARGSDSVKLSRAIDAPMSA
jgi:hypothetical protein